MSIRSVIHSLALAGSLLLTTVAYVAPVQAGSILLYDDFVDNEDRWSLALNGLGHAVTTVNDDSSFSTSLTSGIWDLVVVQFDGYYHSAAASALSTYVGSGGKAIFGHWQTEADAAFDVTQAATNLDTLTLAMFDTGLSSSVLALTNPTYGIYSRSFTAAAGATVAGTFEDGNAGIVIGNSGRTIINGFLGETLGSADEIQLYRNEVNYLLNTTQQQVAEPASLALFGFGLAGLGFARRKRQSA